MASELDIIKSALQQAGIEATLITDKHSYLEKIGIQVKDVDFTRWILDVEGQHFDYIARYYESVRHGSLDYLNYLIAVNRNKLEELHTTELTESLEKPSGIAAVKHWLKMTFTRGLKYWTKLSVRKERGKVVGVHWKGDDPDLVIRLNTDSVLEQKIVERSRTNKKIIKITLFYLSREDYGLIQTENFKLVPPDFEIINMIALHLKAAWLG